MPLPSNTTAALWSLLACPVQDDEAWRRGGRPTTGTACLISREARVLGCCMIHFCGWTDFPRRHAVSWAGARSRTRMGKAPARFLELFSQHFTKRMCERSHSRGQCLPSGSTATHRHAARPTSICWYCLPICNVRCRFSKASTTERNRASARYHQRFHHHLGLSHPRRRLGPFPALRWLRRRHRGRRIFERSRPYQPTWLAVFHTES